MDTCTLALEFNYTKSNIDQGTVWLANGDRRTDLTHEEALEVHPDWIKVAGPLPYEVSQQIHSALKHFFSRNSIAVFDEGIAD